MSPFSSEAELLPPPAAPNRARQLSAVVVDPSCYSLPYDFSLCNGLAGAGCGVTLARSEFIHSKWTCPASFEDRPRFYRLSHGPARKFAGSRLWRAGKALEHLWSMRRFVEDMRAAQPDVVHFQWLPLPFVDAQFLRQLARVSPLVMTVHNTGSLVHGAVSRWQSEAAAAFASFRAVIVHTEHGKAQLLNRGLIAADRIHVIPHGVLNYYAETQPPLPPEPEPAILFFGSIQPYKGLDLLVEAFGWLPTPLRSRCRLIVAGKPGINVRPIQERALALGIGDRIDWKLGFIPEQDVPGLFHHASVVALPYREIDQSGVLMTAIAFDKPVIASRVGGFAETIQDGVHGLLVEPGSVPNLAGALEVMLSDSQARRSMSQSVRLLRTGRLSWESVAKRTYDLYRSLAA